MWAYQNVPQLREEAAKKGVFKGDAIDLYVIDPAFLDALEPHVGKSTKLELVRTEGQLYVTVDGETLSTTLEASKLLPG